MLEKIPNTTATVWLQIEQRFPIIIAIPNLRVNRGCMFLPICCRYFMILSKRFERSHYVSVISLFNSLQFIAKIAQYTWIYAHMFSGTFILQAGWHINQTYKNVVQTSKGQSLAEQDLKTKVRGLSPNNISASMYLKTAKILLAPQRALDPLWPSRAHQKRTVCSVLPEVTSLMRWNDQSAMRFMADWSSRLRA